MQERDIQQDISQLVKLLREVKEQTRDYYGSLSCVAELVCLSSEEPAQSETAITAPSQVLAAFAMIHTLNMDALPLSPCP